jgi:hypothetical protein
MKKLRVNRLPALYGKDRPGVVCFLIGKNSEFNC